MATSATKDEVRPIRSMSTSVQIGFSRIGVSSAALVPNYQSGDRGAIRTGSASDDFVGKSVQKKRQCCYRQKAKCHEHIIYFCALSVASYFGVLTRIYLSRLATWNGVPLFPSLYAEIVGTAIMGFIGSHKIILNNYKATYQAIATGLCGSITTFSSWNSEAMNILLQVEIDQLKLNNASRVIGWGTTIILGLGMPIAALLFGRHVAFLSPWSDSKLKSVEDGTQMGSRSKKTWCVVSEGIAYVILWIVCTVVAVVLTYKYNRMDLMFSILFASLGTYFRWHLAPFNESCADFKLGTFVVNVLGAWILGGVTVAKTSFSNNNQLLLSALAGIATGFCGCLTTVSTFAVELNSLSLKGTYVYACCSLAAAQIGLLIIRGTYEWTK